MSLHFEVGMRVREISTGQEGVVERIAFDNSCSDPDCCGGPAYDLAHIRFACGHQTVVSGDVETGWEGFELINEPDPAFRERDIEAIPPPSAIQDLKEFKASMKRLTNAKITLEPDAHGHGVRVVHSILGPVSRVGWNVIASNPGLRNMLQTLAPLPEEPAKIADERPLTGPRQGQTVVEVATGVRGSIAYLDPGHKVADVSFDCGHRSGFLIDKTGKIHDLASLEDPPQADATP